jgi:hypothetical protein
MNAKMTTGIGTIKMMAAAHVSFKFFIIFFKDKLDRLDGSKPFRQVRQVGQIRSLRLVRTAQLVIQVREDISQTG